MFVSLCILEISLRISNGEDGGFHVSGYLSVSLTGEGRG